MRVLVMVVSLTALLVLPGAATSTVNTGTRAPLAPSSLAFWNAKVGLIGFDSCASRCSRGAVALTEDGGRTSRIVFSADEDVHVVAAHGTSDAWLATSRCRLDPTSCRTDALLVTHDRGRHWRVVARRAPLDPSFATAKLGLGLSGGNPYGSGPTGIVLTSDGGRSWHRIRSPCRDWMQASVSFPRPDRAWALCLGQPGVGSQEKAVYESRDRGRTWHARAETIVFGHRRVHGGISFYGYPLAISFAGDGTGLLVESRGTLYTTRDGGLHWQSHQRLVVPEADFGIAGSSLRGGDSFVLVRRMPTIKLIGHADRRWTVRHRWTLPGAAWRQH
jgi:hypothetical protein